MVISITLTVEISSYFVSRNTQFSCDSVHRSMGKTVFYCTKAIKCCTHNSVFFMWFIMLFSKIRCKDTTFFSYMQMKKQIFLAHINFFYYLCTRF